MDTVRIAFFLTALLTAAGIAGAAAAVPSPSPAPSVYSLPEIYHTVSRPLCSALKAKVGPSIAMMSQNDATIAKSPAFFKEYVNAQFNQSDAAKSMALLHLETLVTPLVNNILAIQKLLDDPSVFPDVPQSDDDQRKDELKAQLLQALAAQQGALDIINGFVDTQDLADMQHEGFGYISAITSVDTSKGVTNAAGPFGATPDPLHPQMFDSTAINAGLSPNPYEINLANIPGLALGYNPVSHLRDGVIWTQGESAKSEGTLAKTVIDDAHICSAPQASPSPKP